MKPCLYDARCRSSHTSYKQGFIWHHYYISRELTPPGNGVSRLQYSFRTASQELIRKC